MFLLSELLRKKKGTIVIGHVNHAARGIESDKDQELVENIAGRHHLDIAIHKEKGRNIDRIPRGMKRVGEGTDFPPGFEENARKVRHEFLGRLARKVGAEKVAMAHTADDQVETILMRFFEGAGIAGLKGIPRETEGGIVRPILDVWKGDIVAHLKRHKMPYRVDKSNLDTRFERNWVRHVLIPLLEKRYGKGVKKRIFTLGERFREIDVYLDLEAGRWVRRNVKPINKFPPERARRAFSIKRASLAGLPAVLRIRILQKIGFDRLGLAPNERLLASMDKVVRSGKPSARLKIGKGWGLVNRYEEARFVPSIGNERSKKEPESRLRHGEGPDMELEPGSLTGPGKYVVPFQGTFGPVTIVWEERGNVAPSRAKRFPATGDSMVLDVNSIHLPLAVRPLRPGDRIRPYGLDSEKKVKEILIDRKVPREERWGRPVVCDANGKILWIPGVVRSALAPVRAETKKTVHLRRVRKSSADAPGKTEPSPRSRK